MDAVFEGFRLIPDKLDIQPDGLGALPPSFADDEVEGCARPVSEGVEDEGITRSPAR